MGVIYDKNDAKVTHWRRSHTKDGASGYRLDWNDMCVVWTGDGRPSELDIKYAKGCDLYITETQAELMSISSGVAGVPPFVGRYTIDTHHTPTYALGYLCDKIQPRLCMSTHMQHDPLRKHPEPAPTMMREQERLESYHALTTAVTRKTTGFDRKNYGYAAVLLRGRSKRPSAVDHRPNAPAFHPPEARIAGVTGGDVHVGLFSLVQSRGGSIPSSESIRRFSRQCSRTFTWSPR